MAVIGNPSRILSMSGRLDAERLRRLARGVSAELDVRRLDHSALWEGHGSLRGPMAGLSGPLWRFASGLRRGAEPGAAGNALRQDRQRGFVGLKALLEAVHDTARVRYGSQPIDIAVPFSQVLILSDQPTFDLESLEKPLEDAIAMEFGPWIDPRLPPRVRFLESRDLDRAADGHVHLRFFVGNGIFAPHSHAAQQALCGRLWLRRPGEDTTYRPRLPGGRLGPAAGDGDAGGLDAAFYRGQMGLAFSGHASLAPAVSPILADDAQNYGAVFYLGRRRDTDGVRFHAWQADRGVDRPRLHAEYRVTDPHAGHMEIGDNEDLLAGRWYGVSRFVGGAGSGEPKSRDSNVFEFQFTPDGLRSGRLHAEDPGGPVLEVLGFVVPKPSPSGPVARLWIDFDADGRPVADWLTARKQALVVGANGYAGVFDRDLDAFGERSKPVGTAPELKVGGRRLRISDLHGSQHDESAPTLLLIEDASSRHAFGYVTLDPDGKAAADGTIEIDVEWLDAAGLVELAPADAPELDRPPGHGQRFSGLAAWHETGPLALQLATDGTLRRARAAPGNRGIAPGADAMLGPLRVRYVPG